MSHTELLGALGLLSWQDSAKSLSPGTAAKAEGLPPPSELKEGDWSPPQEYPEGKVTATCPSHKQLAKLAVVFLSSVCSLSSCLCLILNPPLCVHSTSVRPPYSPDYFDQFTHVDMVWDKELGLVQHWQLFLPFIAFNDDLGRQQRGGLFTVFPTLGHKIVHKSN